MFSPTSSNVTRAQLRNSSARLSRRASHSVKIIGAAAIALLAAGNNLANAAEEPGANGTGAACLCGRPEPRSIGAPLRRLHESSR